MSGADSLNSYPVSHEADCHKRHDASGINIRTAVDPFNKTGKDTFAKGFYMQYGFTGQDDKRSPP